MAGHWTLLLLLLSLTASSQGNAAIEPRVNSVTPRIGGRAGEVVLTVKGQGFAPIYATTSTNDENIGTRIKLTSDTAVYDCDPGDNVITSTRAACNTRAMPVGEYRIKVMVNGTTISNGDHVFKAVDAYTPTIDKFTPRSGVPGNLVKIEGRLFTALFTSNTPGSNNDGQPKITRVYVGGDQLCNLRNFTSDSFYGLQMYGNTRKDGFMVCLPDSTFIGNHDVSFIVDKKHGRSRPHPDLLRVRTNGATMYQTYTEISNVSASSGGQNGGQMLTIHGQYFDDSDIPVRVLVGEQECDVQRPVNDTFIVCQTPPAPSSTPNVHTGNRGLHLTIVNGSSDYTAVQWSSGESRWLDEAYYETKDYPAHASKLEGALIVPEAGRYQFYLKAKGSSSMTVTDPDTDEVVAIVTSSSWYGDGALSEDIVPLAKNKVLKLRVLTGSSGASKVEAAAFHFNTTYSASMTGQARSQKQCMWFNSTSRHEVQSLSITSSGTTSGNPETQRIVIVGDLADKISVCLEGCCTDSFVPEDTSAEDFAAIMTSLPNMFDGSVSATKQGTTFDVTFSPELGDLPLMEAFRVDPNSQGRVTVSTVVQGIPSLNTFRLTFGDATTKPLPMEATTAEMLHAMENIIRVRCHDKLSVGARLMDCEVESTCSGWRLGHEEPFCGQYSARNPYQLYDSGNGDGYPIKTDNYNTLCFAYRGPLLNLTIQFKYISEQTKTLKVANASLAVSTRMTNSPEWFYECRNIHDLALQFEGEQYKLTAVWPVADTGKNKPPLFMDHVYLNKGVTLPDTTVAPRMRTRQARPNGAFIRNVNVTRNAQSGAYIIRMKPFRCGHRLSLISVARSEITHGSTGADSNTASFRLNSGDHELQMTNVRVRAASPPINGTFTMTFNGSTSEAVAVNPDMRPSAVRDTLTLVPGLAGADVERVGSCGNFRLCVYMLNLPGDQPMITVNGSQLTGLNLGTSVTSEQSGGVFYRPMPGDMLRTVHDTAQVKVLIRNLPTACASGVNCGYTWNTANSPAITGITPTSGDSGTQVTITGTGFAAAGNVVTVGNTSCAVTSSSATSLVCVMSAGPCVAQVVKVIVPDVGLASNTGGLTFTFGCSVSSISPTAAGSQGGLNLTITGNGFPANASVTVGGANCPVTYANLTLIICTLPAQQAGSSTSASVVVTHGTTTMTSPINFDYTSSQTPIVSSLSATSFNVWGGQSITIGGSGFGTSAPNVTVNGTRLSVTSHSDTSIVATFPPLPPGSYLLQVLVVGSGLADTEANSIPNINVGLSVTGMTPNFGSMYGGTLLTITGSGFGTNTSIVRVFLGHAPCDVIALTNTHLTCRVGYSGRTRIVTNRGTHEDYGEGYAFDPTHLKIQTGDRVLWKWTTPRYIKGIAYGIAQTVNVSATEDMPGGFSSPPNSANGAYQFQFNAPGVYYYWSRYVNPPYNFLYLRGLVNVTQSLSSLVNLTVTVAGMEARHVTGSSSSSGGSSANAGSGSSCNCVTSLIPNCSPVNDVTANDGSKHQFVFHECATPIVTSFNRRNASSSDPITFTGSGFGLGACQNEIVYGDGAEGVVSTSNSTHLSFTISPQAPPPSVGLFQQLRLRVCNRGNALFAIANDMARRLVVLPVVTGLSPGLGSLAGGTLVTLSGSGFPTNAVDVQVSVGPGFQCVIQTTTATEVTCLTPPSLTNEHKNVSILVYNQRNQSIPAECRVDPCTFHYHADYTPTLTSVSPTTLAAAATSVTIIGVGFGSEVSQVGVTLGGTTCSVTSVTDTQVVCVTGDVPAGSHIPQVTVTGMGLAAADSSHSVTSQARVDAITPLAGSTHGGTEVTISGHGFQAPSAVLIGSATCNVTSETPVSIVCVTSQHAAGPVMTQVTSPASDATFTQTQYTYSTDATPLVIAVSPSSGVSGDSVTITGSGFSATASDNRVYVGTAQAAITQAATDGLVVTVGNQMTGEYGVVVDVEGSGLSNQDHTFEYTLGAFTFSPTTGTIAGGQKLTLTGSGFLTNQTSVTVCDEACLVVSATTTATQVQCITPANSVDTQCQVQVTVNEVTKTANVNYNYDADATPEITGVTPRRGGTAGGTLLTITGSGFGNAAAAAEVTIGGATCVVQTLTDTQITCITNSAASGDYQVDVNVSNMGGSTQTSADFQFIDVWSSPFTWGGLPPPVAGDLVVIPRGNILLLDTSTERLAMLLINGGTVIFDEADLTLHVDRILIVNGGKLQVGTEERRFPADFTATIKLYGHPRSKELPIYGTKMLALREGTLDLHGRHIPVTWAHLAATAYAGDTTVTLTLSCNWQVGDEIVIATTSHRHSQNQTEVHVITGVSADGMTLTLRDPLKYKHLFLQHTLQDGSDLTLRGEVGLLTRNVKVIGSDNDEWHDDVPPCPEGFESGQFATQTCFIGRFGSDTRRDEFGAHIIVHAPKPDLGLVTARLSYIEVRYAGQAFRLGRYPIHFHLNGDMTGSYVRGVAIHDTFNRVVNIHGSHNALVEHTVAYNAKGGAYFLEDGIETGNVFQYNLVIFIHPSSSLLNDDVTPAAFWATNPNNTFAHNAVAGCTHFAFWYRMLEFSSGPSFSTSVCPIHAPLGRFENNTAHSNGWFGLWIFDNYQPHVGGSCNKWATTQMATFRTLTAWNNRKGAEFVNTGSVTFANFTAVNNEEAGIEGKIMGRITHPFNENNGPVLFGGRIVARLGSLLDMQPTIQECVAGGIILPFGNGLLVRGVQFYNFNGTRCAAFKVTSVTGLCMTWCGGFRYHTKNLGFFGSPNKVFFRWESEAQIRDLDGTLTGTPLSSVVPYTSALPPGSCQQNITAMSFGSHPGCVCSGSVKFHRFAFNRPEPYLLYFRNVLFTNQHGTSVSPYSKHRVTHASGWMVLLVSGMSYNMTFQDAPVLTNMTFRGTMYLVDVGDSVPVTVTANRPDRVFVDGGDTLVNMSDPFPAPAEAHHGDWYYDADNNTVSFYVKRDTQEESKNVKLDFRTFRCKYPNCQPPPDPVPLSATPANKEYWSVDETWEFNGGAPQEGDNLTIPSDKWIVIDQAIPRLGHVYLHGGLSADENVNFTLEADYIFVTGHLAIGWPDNPFQGSAKIRLRGRRSDPAVPVDNGLDLGNKFISVFGALDVNGRAPNVTWSRLASTASPGDETLTLEDCVDWKVNDSVMVTTTDLHAWHTETFRLEDVQCNVLTLNDSVAYRHKVHSENLTSTKNLTMTARVALLSRNIVIESLREEGEDDDSFGARIIVAAASFNGTYRKGYARVQNTEFAYTGQEGWTDPSDPRFSIAFVDVSNSKKNSYSSYVRNNTFHNGFAPAVGFFASHYMEVSGNVMHHTVKHAIVTNSKKTTIRNNLMTLNIFSGTYRDRHQTSNFRFDATVEAPKATKLKLEDNIVSGCERVAYHVAGQDCGTSAKFLWSGNEAHSCLTGVASFPEDSVTWTCSLWRGFTVWKNADWGFYLNGRPSVWIHEATSAENGVGVLTMVTGPSILSHALADKMVNITNSFFIGRTSSYNSESLDSSDANIQLSSQARKWAPWGRMTAITFPTFMSGSNDAPRKPWASLMDYNSIKGRMNITGCHFYHFRQQGNTGEVIISTNMDNDDLQHPVYVSNVTLHDVQSSQKIFYHSPNLGKVNSADCVDMDCDAMKKAIVVDTDGSFLGVENGTVIPNSAFEWDGDPRRGLGDYRIPTVMLTASNGSRISVNDTCPKKGIFGTENCTWVAAWNAYNCSSNNVRYGMLVIESMDSDTETRRLSPVAVHVEDYVDLINGPQDHGWCSGYTCRKRVSTFHAIVPLKKKIRVFLTSVAPQKMRFHLLNAAPTDCVGLSIYNTQPHRLDVYVNNVTIMPTNGFMSNGRFFLHPENEQYRPSLENGSMGDNYISYSENTLYWVQCGPDPLEYRTADVLIVSFGLPAMNNTQFYGEGIVNHLAQFLGVPPSKVRIMNVVQESGSSGRRKRQASVNYFFAEIGNYATDNTAAPNLTTAADRIVTQTLLYGMDSVLNTTVLYTAIREPLAGPGAQLSPLHKVGSMVMSQNPEGGREGIPFPVQPILQVKDIDDVVVDYLGAMTKPWQVEVSIRSGGWGLASLIGNTTITFVNGTAEFTDLGVDRLGEYTLDFNITQPVEANGYSLTSYTIYVEGRNLRVEGEILTEDEERLINSSLHLSFHLVDEDTGDNVTEIDWQGHSWTATASIADPDVYPGTWEGTTNGTFDPVTGVAEFDDWRLSDSGVCPVLVTVQSWPNDYTFLVETELEVKAPWQQNLAMEDSATVALKFPIGYSDPGVARRHAAHVRNSFSDQPDVVITSHDSWDVRGYLGVTLVVEGTNEGVNSTIFHLCDLITNETTFTFSGQSVTISRYMSVDGEVFYGVSCGETMDEDDEDNFLSVGIIAAGVVACVALLVIPAIVMLWFCKGRPRSNVVTAGGTSNKSGERLEDVLFREDSFASLPSRASTAFNFTGDKSAGPELPPMPGTPDTSTRPPPPLHPYKASPPIPRKVSPLPPELDEDRTGSSPAMDTNLSKRPPWRI